MSPLAAWLAAIRPRTLGLSVSPVLLGTALAFAETGRVHAGVFLATLLAALLIQIGTNPHNDVADFLRGTDTPERLGPARATAQGWLSPQAVSRAAILAFALALVAGLFLAWVGGWPIVVLGLVSLAAGAAYSGGPWPLSSLPVGELFVFLFFGVVAVAGSHYLQTGYWSAAALLGGAILGLPAAAVLLVNNFRDRHGDARAGRRTLAILLPAPGSHRAYAVMMLAPFALLPGLAAAHAPAALGLAPGTRLLACPRWTGIEPGARTHGAFPVLAGGECCGESVAGHSRMIEACFGIAPSCRVDTLHTRISA